MVYEGTEQKIKNYGKALASSLKIAGHASAHEHDPVLAAHSHKVLTVRDRALHFDA